METGAYNINMVMDTGAYNLNMVQQHKKKPKVLVCMVMKNRLRRVTVMHISMEVK